MTTCLRSRAISAEEKEETGEFFRISRHGKRKYTQFKRRYEDRSKREGLYHKAWAISSQKSEFKRGEGEDFFSLSSESEAPAAIQG